MLPFHPTQVHGHRGCSGHGPENTVPAFLHAARTGCQWLELDVVITADDQVLVSHEPWMDHHACRDPHGKPITQEQGRSVNIFKLSLEEVQRYQCFSEVDADSAHRVHKPTLAETVQAVDRFAEQRTITPPGFNIEVKSEPALYGSFQLEPRRFAELVVQEVIALGIAQRCIIQSFDVAILEAVHGLAPLIPVALLVENADGMEANLQRLTFTPNYYSPAFSIANAQLAEQLRERNIGLLVWTVNEETDIEGMLELGVDGIITDFPERAMALVGKRY